MGKLRTLFLEIKYSFRQIRRQDANILTFILYGLLYDIVINTYKPFAANFLERLGGTDFHVALYNSLPGAVAILALIPGSLFIVRFKKKKRVTLSFFIASRLFLMLMACIPFFNRDIQPMMFVIIVAVMNFPDAISQTALHSFLGENFEGTMRAKAISLRTKFGQMTILIVTLLTGLVIRFLPKTPDQTLAVYQVFFGIAFLSGVFEIITFSRFKERKLVIESDTKPAPFKLAKFKKVFADKKFIRFMILSFAWHFSWQLIWPAISAFQVFELNANEFWFAIYAVSSGGAAFFGAGFFGKLVIKHGNDKMLVVSFLLVAGNALMYCFFHDLWFGIPLNIYGGFVGTSITITLFNGLLEATPDDDRVIYIAAYNTLINTSLAITPLVFLWMLNFMSYYQIFAVDTALRILVGFVGWNLLIRKKGKKNPPLPERKEG